jgi:hypothetical protein
MGTNRFTLLCNAGGALIALVIGGYFASSLVRDEPRAACGERFATTASLPLETSSGDLVSAIELQARAGRREYGLLDNARVIRAGGAPAPAVVEIGLGAAPAEGRNGIGMRWSPPGLAEARAVCLSYGVWLPDDFDFGGGGLLPGLFGGAESEDLLRPDPAEGFAVLPGWRSAGALDAVLQMSSAAGKRDLVERGKTSLPRGRWVEIAQEIRINAPGKADGELRIWVGGELMLERRSLAWRKDGATAVGGVLAVVGHGTLDRASGVRSPTAIRLTPFELAWQ